jgi:hypothetical protein
MPETPFVPVHGIAQVEDAASMRYHAIVGRYEPPTPLELADDSILENYHALARRLQQIPAR